MSESAGNSGEIGTDAGGGNPPPAPAAAAAAAAPVAPTPKRKQTPDTNWGKMMEREGRQPSISEVTPEETQTGQNDSQQNSLAPVIPLTGLEEEMGIDKVDTFGPPIKSKSQRKKKKAKKNSNSESAEGGSQVQNGDTSESADQVPGDSKAQATSNQGSSKKSKSKSKAKSDVKDTSDSKPLSDGGEKKNEKKQKENVNNGQRQGSGASSKKNSDSQTQKGSEKNSQTQKGSAKNGKSGKSNKKSKSKKNYIVRMYGHYRCNMCRRFWTSAFLFCRQRGRPLGDEVQNDAMAEYVPAFKQECQDCLVMRGPFFWDFLTCSNCGDKVNVCECKREQRPDDGKKPHRSNLCQKCQLGYPCIRGRTVEEVDLPRQLPDNRKNQREMAADRDAMVDEVRSTLASMRV